MTANIRTPQRTVSAMQRFAVSQKNHAEAITISPFLLSLPYRTENRRFSALSCTKTGGTQPKLSAACFVVQSCLADADFVVFSNYCLIGTRLSVLFFASLRLSPRWGKAAARRRLMRAELANASREWVIAAHSPLIRPRAGPRPPSPAGEGYLAYSSSSKISCATSPRLMRVSMARFSIRRWASVSV